MVITTKELHPSLSVEVNRESLLGHSDTSFVEKVSIRYA